MPIALLTLHRRSLLESGWNTRSMISPVRRPEALLLKRVGYDGWSRLNDFGKRWIAEIVISVFKRLLGDTLTARRFLSQR